MVCLDKLGWPIELIKGRPITNFIRLLIHTRKIVRKWDGHDTADDGETVH